MLLKLASYLISCIYQGNFDRSESELNTNADVVFYKSTHIHLRHLLRLRF